MFHGFLTSRETAAEIGLDRSSGTASAAERSRTCQPIRMTNINLEPGDGGVARRADRRHRHGIYLETNRSWSIDDRRLDFQFGTEWAREIKDGRLGRMLRNATYAGVTPEFWGSLDAVAGRASGGSGACPTAARASRARSATSPTAPRRPASATCRSA